VALVCLVWGEEFADFFARYCVPSLLEPHNVPLLAREQELTLLLFTDRATQGLLDRCASLDALSKFAKIEWLSLEQLPSTARTNHWVPWQYAVAGRGRDFDVFLVIIPDCVYAAGSLGAIIEALEEHDTVYYRLPQVCRETVAVELDGLRRVDGHDYIGITSLQVVELFIRHVNPKHAAAACAGTFFLNHPEYAIQLSAERMVVSEISSHPLAVRSSAHSVSYTFDAVSSAAKTCYLEILGVSAEPAMKFVEQYYRWPKLYRDQSRLMNLGKWALNFRDASISAHSRSATHVPLDSGRVLGQCQAQVACAKTRFTNATLDFLAVATQVYERAREFPDGTAAKYVALAMAAPGFHRHLRGLRSSFTVVLPKTANRFEEVVRRIETHPAATEILRRFLLLHIVADHVPIVPGHAIILAYPDAFRLPKAFVVDPHTVAVGSGLWAKALSPPQWMREDVFCIEADIDYSYLAWSTLDPVGGTSECVLDHSLSAGAMATEWAFRAVFSRNGRFSIVRAYETVSKLPLLILPAWLAGNLCRKATGRRWLSMENAGIRSPLLHLAEHELRRTYEIASRIWRRRSRISNSRQLPPKQSTPSYDAVSKLNIVDNVTKIMRAFYERLGSSPQQSPVYTCLANIRSKLAEEVEAATDACTESSLGRFELAWLAYEAGRTDEALQLFRWVIADERLLRASAADPRAREACIRAAEIVARHAELRRDTATATQLYRRILEFDGNGIVARRLLLMHWRETRIREAAKLAPRVVQSDCNLAQYLRGSDAVNDLARRLAREARREPTTARGQDARDFGLQAR
jgi:hypothetical protein